MTFGIIEEEEPLLAELIALAFESVGHECVVIKDIDQATRILHAIRIDSIVLDIRMAGRNGLEWLESVATTWPDLPARTLLLTNAALTPDEAARIEKLGAEVVFRPFSLASVKLVVMERVRKARPELAGRTRRAPQQEPSVELSN